MTPSALVGGIDVTELRSRLAARELSCADVVEGLLQALGDDPFHAWAAVDPPALRARAAYLDGLPLSERDRLAQFGVPVAIKDNFDTADLETAYGSSIYAGHRPRSDAAMVAMLRAAGAIVAGKTKCAEFAWMSDGILTPSATGVPPAGQGFTGDPLFCRVWTLIGAPSVSLPLAWTRDGLPAGLQLVGARDRDRRTLATAAALMVRR
jgi:Asp-tRNA(Asn)/Glu-tRNA(Gln) amidotransferase A subunit family amidase